MATEDCDKKATHASAHDVVAKPVGSMKKGQGGDFSSPVSLPSVAAASSHGSATTAVSSSGGSRATYASSSPEETVAMEAPETKFDLGPTRRTLFHKLHPWDRKAKLKTPQELQSEQSTRASSEIRDTQLKQSDNSIVSEDGVGHGEMVTPPPNKQKYHFSSKIEASSGAGEPRESFNGDTSSVVTANTAKSTPSPHQQHYGHHDSLPRAISTRRAPTDEMLLKSSSSIASISSSETTVVPSWNLSQSDDAPSRQDEGGVIQNSMSRRYRYVLTTGSGSQSHNGDDNGDSGGDGYHYHSVEVPLEQSFVIPPPSSLMSKQIHPINNTDRRSAQKVIAEEVFAASSSISAAVCASGESGGNHTPPSHGRREDAVSSPTASSSGSSSSSGGSVESTNSIVRKDTHKENQAGKTNGADSESAVASSQQPLQPTQLHMVMEDPPEEAESNNMCASVNQQLADIIHAFGHQSLVTPRSAKTSHPSTMNDVSRVPQPSASSYESPPPIVQSSPFDVSSTSIGSAGSLVETPVSMKGQYKNENFDQRSHRNEEWMISRVESLDRECTALKRIIQQDAIRMLNLQGAVDAQKHLNALKEVEIVDKHTELKISEDRILRLKKDREHYVERETELVETIKILKAELDRMTLHRPPQGKPESDEVLTTAVNGKSSDVDSSHIAEQRSLIQELQSIIREKEDSILGMQAKIDWLESRQALWETKSENGEDYNTKCGPQSVGSVVAQEGQEVSEDGNPIVEPNGKEENSQTYGQQNILGILEVVSEEPEILEQEVSQVSVITLLEDISQRLAAVENERFERESTMMAEIQKNRTDMEEMHRLILGRPEQISKRFSDQPLAVDAADDINVAMTSSKSTQNDAEVGMRSPTWCCDISSVVKGSE